MRHLIYQLADDRRLDGIFEVEVQRLPWAILPEPYRSVAREIVRKRRIDTLEELLSHRWPSPLVHPLEEWVLGTVVAAWLAGGLTGHGEAEPEADEVEVEVEVAGLTPGMSREALNAWAEAHHVRDLLDQPLSASAPALAYFHTGQSLASVICDGNTGAPAWWTRVYGREHAQNQAIEALAHVAQRTAVALAHEAEATWRSQPPEHPKLRALHAALTKKRAALRLRSVPRASDPHVALQLSEDPPTLHVLPDGWALPLEHAAVKNLPAHPIGALRLVDAALDALTAPAHADLRARAEEALARPAWQRDLVALDRLLAVPELDPSDDKNLLGWRLGTSPDGWVTVDPVRCRPKKRGPGLVTRTVDTDDVPQALLTDPTDAALHELLSPWRTPPREVVLEVLELLVGHPRVFPPGRSGDPLPVRRSRFLLSVELDGDEARCVPTIAGAPVSFDELREAVRSRNLAGGRLALLRDDGLHVARLPFRAATILMTWLARAPSFPPEAHDHLLDAVGRLAAVTPVQVAPGLRGPRVPADPRPLLLLHWEPDSGLVLEARVRPVPELPPEVPGQGSSELFVRRDGRRRCVERDLDAEPAAVTEALAPLRLPERASQGRFAWRLSNLQDALGVVERLQEHLTDFQIEWRGDVPRVGQRVATSDLRLSVGEGRDWFGLKGAARHPDGSVDVGALLRSIDAGHDYVQVAQGTWAKIDRALRDQLALVSNGAGQAELTLLQAPIVQALAEAGAEVDLPVDWSQAMERLEEARTLTFDVPAGLEATLRDYQLVGFRWMAALAHWAPGACLADDMGLGKTVQSIALLLHRAARGPALVVAPTSVTFNWQRELARFAPSLKVHVHHGAARDADAVALGPGDVLLTTYGVLVNDAEPLHALRFATAILDEAQAIKNPSTRRAEAAFGLQADFRLALSGTPVENRVSELWSLFRFVAPGLLGGWARFRDRYATPIEVRGDQERRAALARQIRPFVLRRAKEQVERELPPLTETLVEVTLSEAERALYATARVRAIERLNRGGDHLQVFRELSILRQLACHPKLVDPGSTVPSSKLRQVRRLVSDLRENGHRALVFSQFVRHLTLVREALEADGARVRYLDGSTPLAERRREVDAFQSGDGDVFLISLEAGGVGLNLTAADHVVHLDPWWNPAKEDQATDRAHRIGQTRPVTVHRVVSRGTIEQQILNLHAEKRELAEALLTGADTAGRLSPDELKALLEDHDDDPVEALAAHAATLPEATEPPEPAGRPRLRIIDGGLGRPGLDLERLFERFCDALDLAHQRGDLAREATVRQYRAAVRNLLDDVAPHAPADPESLVSLGEDYVRRAKAGEGRAASDKVYAGPAWSRLVAVLDAGA